MGATLTKYLTNHGRKKKKERYSLREVLVQHGMVMLRVWSSVAAFGEGQEVERAVQNPQVAPDLQRPAPRLSKARPSTIKGPPLDLQRTAPRHLLPLSGPHLIRASQLSEQHPKVGPRLVKHDPEGACQIQTIPGCIPDSQACYLWIPALAGEEHLVEALLNIVWIELSWPPTASLACV